VLGQEELLEDEADPGGPQRGQLAVGQLLDVEVGDPYQPGGGSVQVEQAAGRHFAASPGVLPSAGPNPYS
jgi:hypothetical protein